MKAIGRIAMQLNDRSTQFDDMDVADWRPEKATDTLREFVEASGRLIMKHLMEVSGN